MARTIKAIRLFNHILLGLVLLILTGAIWDNHTKLLKATKQWWLFRITRLMGMNIEVIGTLPEKSSTGFLFVSNHVSWIDIPVIGGLTQLNFLSKAEVRQWPLIGRLADSAGTLFIKRGSGDTDRVIRQMADYLGSGRSVLFFPEGTTSDGSGVTRFHRKLFRTCEHIETRVCPVAIHYSVDNCDYNPVAFIGDDEFTSHLWNLLGHDRIRVTVSILEPRIIETANLDAHINQIRQEISQQLAILHGRKRVNTSARSPDASSPDDQTDEAASF